jgi:transposase/predicted DNA-binding ribbon-helix-helix protein
VSGLFWLSQAQFDRIKPHFPLAHGVPRVDDLRVVSGIVHVIRNGLQWKDAPSEYGPHRTLYHRFLRWSRMGIFNRILEELSAEDIALDWLVIEAEHLEAQRTAARLLKNGMFPSASQARARNGSKGRNIPALKRYTTVGIELELQNALKEIAVIEGCSVRGLCATVYDLKKPTNSFAAALRVFIVAYYRAKSKSVLSDEVSQVLKKAKANAIQR